MKTTIEVHGYEIVIEETETGVSVSAMKDDEAIESFELDVEGGIHHTASPFMKDDEDMDDEDMDDEDMDFEEESDFEDEDFEEDELETKPMKKGQAQGQRMPQGQAQGQRMPQAQGQRMPQAQEEQTLESFGAFISRKTKTRRK